MLESEFLSLPCSLTEDKYKALAITASMLDCDLGGQSLASTLVLLEAALMVNSRGSHGRMMKGVESSGDQICCDWEAYLAMWPSSLISLEIQGLNQYFNAFLYA